MLPRPAAHIMLDQEARALLTRLARIRPLALHETMVPAAMPSTPALLAIEDYLGQGRRELRARIQAYRAWLRGSGRDAAPHDAQQRFVFLRLRFNRVLAHFDLFSDVLTQRSEHVSGAWLAGLDAVAADALSLEREYFAKPAVVCYLDRGHGAAIRRAHARLPGGGNTPVAIVRIPRERMVGAGIASSLVHEVGHQGAALLDLVNALRRALRARRARGSEEVAAWALWERWVSEILADLWAIARVGVGSTTGLIAILSLPRAFVFRMNPEDPHPMPWIRVRLSCALGAALYPDGQWSELAHLWAALYPLTGDIAPARRAMIAALERTIPDLARFLLDQRPPALGGDSLFETLRSEERTPARLRACHRAWGGSFQTMRAAPPSLACAVLAQARTDGSMTPERESRLLADLLTYWALRQALTPTRCDHAPPRVGSVVAAMTSIRTQRGGNHDPGERPRADSTGAQRGASVGIGGWLAAR